MIWFLLAFAAAAVLAPLIGADSRDSRDWRADEPSPDLGGVRTSGSRVRLSSAPERAAAHRPASAAC
ncbi:hypothetical protein SAMN05216275_101112 [Streptosporangium canum]|uniref:Uncharacterized protein n=1 Tax=Streptosporangium canum TaxID=324952 RepID=A0A1I3FDZ3_9ACTN|nr:hypothetical protein SAMN05216275_101112 [Streptosporangium canum]